MGLPPRPRTEAGKPKAAPEDTSGLRAPAAGEDPFSIPIQFSDTQPSPAPAELDEDTRDQLAQVIAKAIAAQLGHVRISSIPPSAIEPRSSIRVAAQYAGKYTGKVGKLGVYVSGALSLLGTLIVWLMKPEYAGPLAQALKLIAGVIMSAAGGGTPAAEPPARDVPALASPGPAPALAEPAPDASP